jgi:ABC-type Na+ efflux pump permease subunit
MFIPITSLDGAVSMLTVPIPVEPQILALLTEILGEDGFSELTSALGG